MIICLPTNFDMRGLAELLVYSYQIFFRRKINIQYKPAYIPKANFKLKPYNSSQTPPQYTQYIPRFVKPIKVYYDLNYKADYVGSRRLLFLNNNLYQLLNLAKNKTSFKSNRLANYISVDRVSMPGFNNFTANALNSLKLDNAGGKSAVSEALSINILDRYYHASNFIFEKEVQYIFDYKMVDYICTIGQNRIGVSVTRAIGQYDATNDSFDANKFTAIQATELLEKKFSGLIVARKCVTKELNFYTAKIGRAHV